MKIPPPIHQLPNELLVKIIEKLPRPQWPHLELIDRKFRDAVLLAWGSIRKVDIIRDFIYSESKAIEDENDRTYRMIEQNLCRQISQKTETILKKLIHRSPRITSLIGLSLCTDDPTLNAAAVQYLSRFKHLETIKFIRKHFSGEIRIWCGIPLTFIEFFESTQSRSTLKEIDLNQCRIRHDPIIVASFDQRLCAAFANNPNDPTRPLLRLESISMRKDFGGNYPLTFLNTIDASKFKKLSLGDLHVEPAALTTLVNGAPHLQHLDFEFMPSCEGHNNAPECPGGRLQSNKQLLVALGSRQQLSSLGLNEIWNGGGCVCHRFETEFKKTLRTIAPQLVNFVFVPRSLPTAFRMGDIRDIIQQQMPNLKSIKLGDVCANDPEELRGIADGKELEEIEIGIDSTISSNDNYTVTLNEVLSTIINKSPRLKRFNINYFVDQRVAAELCNLTDLVDLRFRADQLTTENFVAFSHQIFAEKLQILRLGSIGEGVESGFLEWIGKATQLRQLIVERNVTSRLLECLAESCPSLEIMFAWYALDGITFEGVQTLVDRCPKLRWLAVTNSNTDRTFTSSLKKELKLERYRILEFDF